MNLTGLYKKETDNGNAVYFTCLCCTAYGLRGSMWTVEDTQRQMEQHIKLEHLVPKNVAGEYFELPVPKSSWFGVADRGIIHTGPTETAPLFQVACRRCAAFVHKGTAKRLMDPLGKHAALELLAELKAHHAVPAGAHIELETYIATAYLCCDVCDHRIGFTPTLTTVDYTSYWNTAISNHVDGHKVKAGATTVEDPLVTVMNELARTGHGHVVPSTKGTKARCGGAALCPKCSQDKVRLDRAREASEEMQRNPPVTHTNLPAPPQPNRFVQNDVIIMVVDNNQGAFEDVFMRWMATVPTNMRKYITGPFKAANGAHTYIFLPTGMDQPQEFAANVDKTRDQFVNLFTVSDLTTTDVMGIRARWPWSPTEPSGAMKWMLPNADNN